MNAVPRKSLWTRPIFGKGDTSPLAGPVAIRMYRIHAAGALDVIPWIVAGLFLSDLLRSAEMFIFLVLAAPAGIPRKEAAAKLGEVFFSGASPWSVAARVIIPILFVLAFRSISRVVLDRGTARQTIAKRLAARKMRRRSRLVLCAVPLCLLGLIVAFALVTHSWVPALMGAAHVLTPMAAMLLPLSLLNRDGARIVCGRCGYPMGSWRGSADRCPECGQLWHDPWKARSGERRMSRCLAVASAVCLVLALASVVLAGHVGLGL